MMDFIRNTAIGGAIMATIAFVAYYVPHAEYIILAFAFIAMAYGLGTIIEAAFSFYKDKKKIESMSKERDQRELING